MIEVSTQGTTELENVESDRQVTRFGRQIKERFAQIDLGDANGSGEEDEMTIEIGSSPDQVEFRMPCANNKF